MYYFQNNSIYGNATLNNIGSLVGKMLSFNTPYEQVSPLQASLGLANDLALIITPVGNASALSKFINKSSAQNTFGLVNSYYVSTVGLVNNVKSLKE
jgi:hypothetical protein